MPWTLADEDNWAYTHRLAGKVWTIGGLVILALTFLRLPALQFVVILVLVLIPTAASFLYGPAAGNEVGNKKQEGRLSQRRPSVLLSRDCCRRYSVGST